MSLFVKRSSSVFDTLNHWLQLIASLWNFIDYSTSSSIYKWQTSYLVCPQMHVSCWGQFHDIYELLVIYLLLLWLDMGEIWRYFSRCLLFETFKWNVEYRYRPHWFFLWFILEKITPVNFSGWWEFLFFMNWCVNILYSGNIGYPFHLFEREDLR